MDGFNDGGFGGFGGDMSGSGMGGGIGGMGSMGFGDGFGDPGSFGGSFGESVGQGIEGLGDMGFGGYALSDVGMPDMGSFGIGSQGLSADGPSFGSGGISEDSGFFGKLSTAAKNALMSTVLGKLGLNTPATPAIMAGLQGKGPVGVTNGAIQGLAGFALNGLGPLGTLAGLGLGMANNSGLNSGLGNQGSGQTGNSSGNLWESLPPALASLYMHNQAGKGIDGMLGGLQSLYSQNSPYSQALRQQLERRDAAAGRRSQYGPREVELQAKLAQMASSQIPAMTNLMSMQNQNRNSNVNTMLQLFQKSGGAQLLKNGIGSLFNDGWSGAFNPQMGPALDPYGAGSGWGQDTLPAMDIPLGG